MNRMNQQIISNSRDIDNKTGMVTDITRFNKCHKVFIKILIKDKSEIHLFSVVLNCVAFYFVYSTLAQ